jgi:hypothetical protein
LFVLLGEKFVNLKIDFGDVAMLFAKCSAETVLYTMHNPRTYMALAYVAVTMFTSCGSHGRGDDAGEGVLVTVGDAKLTLAELHDVIPYGLSGDDSIAWCRSYIDSWIERKAVGIEAARNIADTRRIDKLVDEYRNNLLIGEYRKEMSEQQAQPTYSDDTIRAEYARTPELYRCTQSMVRGIFLSVGRKHPRLNEMRRWMRSSSSADLEKLEKESLDPNVENLYFRDHWLPLTDITERVPGATAVGNTVAGKGFDISVGDRVYLLAVSDYLAPGVQMPFDMARDAVVATLNAVNAADYDRRLRSELVNRAYERGLVTVSLQIADTTATKQHR